MNQFGDLDEFRFVFFLDGSVAFDGSSCRKQNKQGFVIDGHLNELSFTQFDGFVLLFVVQVTTDFC